MQRMSASTSLTRMTHEALEQRQDEASSSISHVQGTLYNAWMMAAGSRACSAQTIPSKQIRISRGLQRGRADESSPEDGFPPRHDAEKMNPSFVSGSEMLQCNCKCTSGPVPTAEAVCISALQSPPANRRPYPMPALWLSTSSHLSRAPLSLCTQTRPRPWRQIMPVQPPSAPSLDQSPWRCHHSFKASLSPTPQQKDP
jgi:hypothetical protein